jgi:hypothetical protein
MTPEEAIAFWSELQRGLQFAHVLRQPPPERRRRTGEMRVTQTERRAMQAFHLLAGENYQRLAQRFRRGRQHVPRWIWDNQYRAFHAYYWAGAHDIVRPPSAFRAPSGESRRTRTDRARNNQNGLISR